MTNFSYHFFYPISTPKHNFLNKKIVWPRGEAGIEAS
jgi:hypothetical protein